MRKNFKFKIKELIGNSREGFTLVELLIVIAIIGILAALLMSNFIGVRQRARDAQRKADLRQIQSAFEIYRSDTSGYPTLVPDCNSPLQTGTPPTATVYMAKFPCDPNSAYNDGAYWFSGGGTTYTLAACLENTGDISTETLTVPPDTSPGGTGTCASGKYYVLTNP